MPFHCTAECVDPIDGRDFATEALALKHEAAYHDGRMTCQADDDEQQPEGPTCSICDGLGHGYPGGPPCPLEERGEQGVPWWAQ